MIKKHFSEHYLYFALFFVLSFLLIYNGYATLGTNDDWALRSMLATKGTYNTFIMCYPLSYLLSHLYDFFPTFQWYSMLLSLVVGVNFYLISIYISKIDSYLQKFLLLLLALLWLTYLWFFSSITSLTMITMMSAVGLLRKDIVLSFLFIFLASFLRTDIMIMFLPYYVVSYLVLRDTLLIQKYAVYALGFFATIIMITCYTQKQDKFYTHWLSFNQARSGIVDIGTANMKKAKLSKDQRAILNMGWWQDSEILPTEQILLTTESLKKIILKKLTHLDVGHFVFKYKFKHWAWLLLFATLLAIAINRKNRKALFLPFLAAGIILLLITRDVDRVTIPLILLWFYILFELFRPYKHLNTVFTSLFVSIFFYYFSSQLTYRYFNEVTTLQKEARQLIKKSKKCCEVSIHYPTAYINEINTVFKMNYIFHENSWLQVNDKEILPTGWLSRHKFFFRTHHMSDSEEEREFQTYHDFLVDDNTAFFGSNYLVHSKAGRLLLRVYDEIYLSDKPECKHTIALVAKSEHFGISQIKIECKP